MPRRWVYDMDVGVPTAVFYGYFTTIDYWQDLVAHYQRTSIRTEIADFSSDETGTDISFSHILSAADLPAIARPVVPGTFVVTRRQHFDPFQDDAQRAGGHFRTDLPAPVDITGSYVMSDCGVMAGGGQGSRMRLETQCRARVPIIGGQIEHLVVTGLKALFAGEGEFTAEWIAGHHPG